MKQFIPLFVLGILFGVVAITLSFYVYKHDVFAYSPSFVRQEIPVNNGFRHTTDKPCTDILTPPKDITLSNISSVSYMSDGRFLNGTFWLTSPGKSPPFYVTPKHGEPEYWIYLDADANLQTGYKGADYAFRLKWVSGQFPKWVYEFIEFSKAGREKIITSQNIANITEFFH